jgi:hypothetical protein
MYYYVYYSYEEWGRGYIGARSCKCQPEEDSRYFGSFYDKTFKPTAKVILLTFATRQEALNAEITLHEFYQVHINPHFANRAKQTSTKFVSNGEGMKKCLELYPDFHSSAGKVGGRVTFERHPELYSANGKEAVKNLWKWRQENLEAYEKQQKENGRKSTEFFRNNPEAAKNRARNGVKALAKYREEHGTPSYPGKGGTKIRVVLPDGGVLDFLSIRIAARELSIPPTSMKRLARGEIVKKYKDYKVIPI